MARTMACNNGIIDIRHASGISHGEIKAFVIPSLSKIDQTRNDSKDIGARQRRGFGVYS
jgi:hypothetical protein